MKTHRIMTVNVTSIAAEESLQNAWALMQRLKVRHLPLRTRGELYGILSDRDLLVHARRDVDGSLKFPPLSAGEATTFHPITCHPTASVGRVARMMIEHKIDSVPVVDLHGRLMGLVTSTDLLRLIADDEQDEGILPFTFDLEAA